MENALDVNKKPELWDSSNNKRRLHLGLQGIGSSPEGPLQSSGGNISVLEEESASEPGGNISVLEKESASEPGKNKSVFNQAGT